MRAALALFFLLGACVSTASLRGVTAGAASYKVAQGKDVVVVIDPALVQDFHANWSDGHKYKFEGVREGVGEAMVKRVSPGAKSVKLAARAVGQELAVIPQVKIKVVNDFWTKGCLVTFGLKIERGGRLLAQEQQDFKKSFIGGDLVDGACREAISTVLPLVADRALENAAAGK